ncbi:MAG TPA: hypothetical protein VIL00_16930 [Pseudonocardiaceae bacterium]
MSRLTDLAELLLLGGGLVGVGVACLVLPPLLARGTRPSQPRRPRSVVSVRRRHRARPGALTVAELTHRLALTLLTQDLR